MAEIQNGFKGRLDSEINPSVSFEVEVSVTGTCDYEFAAFVLDEDGRLSSNKYCLSEENNITSGREVSITLGRERAIFFIHMFMMPARIRRIIFAVESSGGGLRGVGQISVHVRQKGLPGRRCVFPGAELSEKNAVIAAELYKQDGGWQLECSGRPADGGIRQIMRCCGYTFADGEDSDPDSVPPPFQRFDPSSVSASGISSDREKPRAFSVPAPSQSIGSSVFGGASATAARTGSSLFGGTAVSAPHVGSPVLAAPAARIGGPAFGAAASSAARIGGPVFGSAAAASSVPGICGPAFGSAAPSAAGAGSFAFGGAASSLAGTGAAALEDAYAAGIGGPAFAAAAPSSAEAGSGLVLTLDGFVLPAEQAEGMSVSSGGSILSASDLEEARERVRTAEAHLQELKELVCRAEYELHEAKVRLYSLEAGISRCGSEPKTAEMKAALPNEAGTQDDSVPEDEEHDTAAFLARRFQGIADEEQACGDAVNDLPEADAPAGSYEIPAVNKDNAGGNSCSSSDAPGNFNDERELPYMENSYSQEEDAEEDDLAAQFAGRFLADYDGDSCGGYDADDEYGYDDSEEQEDGEEFSSDLSASEFLPPVRAAEAGEAVLKGEPKAGNNADEDIHNALNRQAEAARAAAAAAPEPRIPKTSELSSFSKVGDVIFFGRYPASGNGEEKPLEWQILDLQSGFALLITKFGIDSRPLNGGSYKLGWESCDMQRWLNGSFMETAFSRSERAQIVPSRLTDESAGIEGIREDEGQDIYCKVYLPSLLEAVKYFPQSGESDSNACEMRVCTPTEYAINAGAELYSGGVCWWLRSSIGERSSGICILPDGSIGFCDVSTSGFCVRPMLKLRIPE